MDTWIKYPVTLKGELVELIPLEENHFGELENVARHKKIWEFYTIDGSDPQKLHTSLTLSLIERGKGTQFPFTIFHRQDNQIIGSTRLLDIRPAHRKLEIGWTWLHPGYWATAVNAECKLLLLTYCFETLQAVRVQLKTDENNMRSRKAIEKIGGEFEGILRSDLLRDNNTRRNSAYYSILADEWDQKKQKLRELYQLKKQNY